MHQIPDSQAFMGLIIEKNSITLLKLVYYTYAEESSRWIPPINTSLKKKIENNSTWEGPYYQIEGVKINSSLIIFIFSFYI